MNIRNPKQLAQLLRKAAEAHHVYETKLGHPHKNWSAWYAKFVFSTQQTGKRSAAARRARRKVSSK